MSCELGPANRVLSADEKGPYLDVEVTTLDSCRVEHPNPTFIKIDVEGYELEVIQGGRSVLGNASLLGLLVETFRQHPSPKLMELERRLQEFGFFPCDYHPTSNRLTPLRNQNEGSNNTLYLRDRPGIKSRLQMSRCNLREWGLT